MSGNWAIAPGRPRFGKALSKKTLRWFSVPWRWEGRKTCWSEQHNKIMCAYRDSDPPKNESSPNFLNVCPEICSESSPNILRCFRASLHGKRRPEKFNENPRRVNACRARTVSANCQAKWSPYTPFIPLHSHLPGHPFPLQTSSNCSVDMSVEWLRPCWN